MDKDVHVSLFFRSFNCVSFSMYLVSAVLEKAIDFYTSIFYCYNGDDATGSPFPPFLAPFLSSF